MKKSLQILVSGIFTCFVILAIWQIFADDNNAIARENIAWRSESEQRTIDVYKEASKAVVFISTVTLNVDPFDFFQTVRPQTGSGSGIIVDAKNGIVLTNLHVIQSAHKIEILVDEGQPLDARLLGFDKEYDLAVLQLKKPPAHLKSIPFGDSAQLEVGQSVLAIGNPFGLNKTLTSGIISSLDRAIRTPGPEGVLMKGLIQTDASINPGNSGGPLLDTNGRLIGINGAILSQSGDSAGIGFAVPINEIKRFLPELIATGKILRPYIGWILVDTNQGPMVRRIMSGSPAEKSGLQPIERYVSSAFVQSIVRDFDRADLLLAIDGTKVVSSEHAQSLISKVKPIRPIELTLRRGGQSGAERVVKITPDLK